MPFPLTPIRVAYDISRMSAGGANGGIKTHHFEFLRFFSAHRSESVSLCVFCQAELVEELSFLARGPLNQIHVLSDRGDHDYRASEEPQAPLRFWPEQPERLLSKLGMDLLYCGFGTSRFSEPALPQISLLVDTLHKDLPATLPKAEVEHREHWYREAIERADLVQTNSEFSASRLKHHYGVPEEKLLRIPLPLHGRFQRVELGKLPEILRGKHFFLYPANHWPHKNHQTLLVAFKQYRHAYGHGAWDLALTGGDPSLAATTLAARDALGLRDSVHLLDHLAEPEFKSTWEHARALVFPSLYEGFGVPILEAMHFQKPIIAGRLASIPEIGRDSIHYCDPRQPADLAAAMEATTRVNAERRLYPEILPQYELEATADTLLQAMIRIAQTKPLPT